MIGLKQKLNFQSRQANADISYDPRTIQEVFLHTIYQGLGTKHADIRQRLRPLISNSLVTDEEILGQVMKMISDENEHQRRLSQTPRQKTTHAHSAKVETGDWQSNDKPKASVEDNRNLHTIQQLSAQVEALTRMVTTLIDQQVVNAQVGHSLTQPAQLSPYPLPRTPSQPPPNTYSQPLPSQTPAQVRRRTTCRKCTEQNQQECNHCFVCEEMGHRAVDCLKRTKFQGNGTRSLPRDSQRSMSSPSPNQ